jgi:hypothetical protein
LLKGDEVGRLDPQCSEGFERHGEVEDSDVVGYREDDGTIFPSHSSLRCCRHIRGPIAGLTDKGTWRILMAKRRLTPFRRPPHPTLQDSGPFAVHLQRGRTSHRDGDSV